MIIRTPYGGSLATPRINNLPDRTVPDQSMSIAEIMARYARGLPIGGSRVPFYEEEEDPEDSTMPTGMDKIETIEWIRSNKARIASLQDDLSKYASAAATAQAAEIKSKSLKTPPEA